MKSSKKDYKPKKCRQCGKEFKPFQSLQKVCSVECAIKDSRETTEKNRKKRVREMRKELSDSDRNFWIKKTQTVFNKYIRLRDKNEPCISCGRNEVEYVFGGAWDCGHYRSCGAQHQLRFNPLNAHKQCKVCNGGSAKYAKKGETVGKSYRINLIEKIGFKNVEWLEKEHPIKNWTIDELKEIYEEYRLKVKELESDKGEGSRG